MRELHESPAGALSAFRLRLTEAGIRVSPSELADAARALLALPEALQRPETLCATLKSALVKRSADGPAFDAVFDAFFQPPTEAPSLNRGRHHHNHDETVPEIAGIELIDDHLPIRVEGEGKHEHGDRIDLRRFFGEGDGKVEHDHHGGDRLNLTWFGREMTFDRASAPPPALVRRDGSFGVRRVATSGLPGALSETSERALPRDIVFEGDRRDHWATAGDPDDALLGKTASLIAETLEGGARNVVRSLPDGRRVATSSLPDLRWDELTAADLKRLEAAAVRFGRALGGAAGRPRRTRRGKLDARATFRGAIATGGVPFRPVYRARRDDRPRMVVLCDVSLSVRAAAWFMVQLSRAAQRQSGRVRTFVFVSEFAEATRTIGSGEAIDAVRAIFSGALLDVAASSDAGAALTSWSERFGPLLTARTTVLILGDARNNGRDPGLDALERIADGARRVIWLSPEPRGAWRLAGCDLSKYAPYCQTVEPVRTPADFERIANQLRSS